MIKARIKLNTGELVTKEFDSQEALVNFLTANGHELIRAIRK
ncbi:hypothetical protein Kirov_256 [Bacillus phage Kirov]|uniref:Uncharacterized protein n=1 Tax=Bacillus phage Kirov TaxID=2783539 RepID=A0A7U3NK17_9CAUD|nr:hypothetical protein PQE67_gp048 [Bacillus phage Kirov]QOV08455.1 hypothetical protein Kirov_256 [Bacillus phage Kirov]